jgi:hypothetical protein
MKILVTGDSWGVGEWQPGKHFPIVTASPFCVYLEEGNWVTNVSSPGSRNFDAIERVDQAFKDMDYDVIVAVISDPLRDLRHSEADEIAPAMESLDSFLSKIRSLHDNYYQRLTARNLPVILLGGVCDVDMVAAAQYENLIPLIPSLRTWFDPGAPRGPYLTIQASLLEDIRKEKHITPSPDILEHMKHIEGTVLFDYFRNSSLYPDNGHPNRYCHQRLGEFLRNHLQENFGK